MEPTTLKRLHIFEAVGRLLSFTQAANELGVLQPAVSRQVAELEKELGTPLFHRTKPVLTLTAEGEKLLDGVSDNLSKIEAVLHSIQASPSSSKAVINATIGLTSCYLLDRLVEFEKTHPEYSLELVTRDQNGPYDTHSCDILFTFDQFRHFGIDHFQLFPEEMIMVCGQSHPDVSHYSLKQLAQQTHVTLGSKSHRTDWGEFFAELPQGCALGQSHHEYNSFMVYLQSITNGQLGIGWRYLLDDHIKRGLLRIAHPYSVKGNRGYHCYLLSKAHQNPAARAFFKWAKTLAFDPA